MSSGASVALILAALTPAACSAPALLGGLNSLTPGDSDARRVVSGVAYGPAQRQALDLWAPRTPSSEARPVIVFFYGGGWVSGSRQEYGFAARAYAARGFLVVVPDYRLVPTVRFPAFVEDGALAMRWARDNVARYGGDPGRITIAGHSAGAYIGAMLGLDRRYLAAAGVPPGTIRAAALLAGPYDFYPFTEQRGRDALGAWPKPIETQPIDVAQSGAPPIWLGAGTADTVVLPRNSIAMAARLEALHDPVTLKLYPGKSHIDLVLGLSKPFRGKAPTLADTSAFLLANSR